ncbi:MAG: deoxyribodipyrimidine photolyase [Cereibacter sphaeroides]|uniref:Deoxyribodipyrimidine photolyase n=1 Tax=Cereibacter sphaeroides TaxID=1063 RepID=A0A2W5S9Y0_CERSP|nr:MAG: deoxyribodipyrimidine photolyase [Cereibacter sphaeroides]
MTDAAPLILWFRRDLRLADHPMLAQAAATKRPLIPLFILDPETEAQGAAPLWRLGLSVEVFAKTLEAAGSRLILRRGPALKVLQAVIAETGAREVHWSRLYDPAAKARDTKIKAELKDEGIGATSHPGHVLFEPWTVQTGQGGPYRVYTPYWNAVRNNSVAAPMPGPKKLHSPEAWPASDKLAEWKLGAAMNRGAKVVAPHQAVGEAAALERLDRFIDDRVQDYSHSRDYPAHDATSRLSENLTYGEIAPARIWHAGQRARHDGHGGAGSFLRELVWREFGYHLLHHSPEIATRNWRKEWDSFPWRPDNADAERWRRGMTGVPMVDAAMREMYVTGTMHNRARMIAASYLTKHLLTHWKVGLDWFSECLTDWDPASNAMGWQWVAGSGPDAAPYFRVFNPETQGDKFDPKSEYRRRFIAELSDDPGRDALSYFDAAPLRWHLDPKAPYPGPVIGLAEGRNRALAAYAARNA